MTAAPEARRITGPHLLGDRTGAALDVLLAPGEERSVERWRDAARSLLDSVGWFGEETQVRRFAGGANLFVSAPPDALYAATDLAELAWNVAASPGTASSEAVERLKARIERERNPRLIALAAEAARRRITFLHDDEGVSLGSGAGVRVWSEVALPDADSVDWSAVSDVPVTLVTGSNGKTTTVRLAAAIGRAAGHRVGITTTDGIIVDGEPVADSDFAGPMGARRVLRDPRVTLAVLETARGGILRRGLAVRHAAAAVVTNIAEDHFGDFGVQSLEDLADAKLVVSRVVSDSGYLVLNAGDPILRRRGSSATRVVWFAAESEALGGAPGFTIEDGALVRHSREAREVVARIEDVPGTMGGAARHNVENALAAAALMRGLPGTSGALIPIEAIREALTAFTSDSEGNAGRGNTLTIDGFTVLVDYAHNASALEAIGRVAAAIPSERRVIVLGQAGDRTDEAIRGLTRAALALEPDLVLIKELDEYRRGRAPGEVPALIASELDRLGARSRYEIHPDELAAVRRALEWARPGDLLMLLVHENRPGVMALLESRAAAQRLE